MRVQAAADIRDLHEGELGELRASRAAFEAPLKKRRGWCLCRGKEDEVGESVEGISCFFPFPFFFFFPSVFWFGIFFLSCIVLGSTCTQRFSSYII